MDPCRANRAPGARSVILLTLAALSLPPDAGAQPGCGTWSSVTPPSGATGAVTDVAVVSAADAWAITGTLGTVRWDGTSWQQVPLPDLSSYGTTFSYNATGTVDGSLLVSGVAVTSVWTTEQMLLIHDGTDWTRIETMELAQNSFGQPRYGAPRAVDGASVDDVWIVGTASSDGPGVGNPVLMVHWDGSNLVEYATPGLGNRQNDLYDVAVVSSDDVWAVGEWISWGVGNTTQHGMTFHWDGLVWSHVPNPTETIDNVDLHTVAAIATDDVWVAGDSSSGPLFMHWDGTSWTIVPSPATTGTIQDLAPISSNDIWAVDSPWQVPLLSRYYHWDGAAWSIVNVDVPGASQVDRHGGLAAVGACDVWAVGSIDFGTGSTTPYIERLQSGSTVTDAPVVAVTGASLAVTPNPMRNLARIRADDSGTPITQARIYDVSGTAIRTLAVGSARDGSVTWDGRDDHGRNLPGGVYFVRAETGDGRVLSKKVTLVR